MNPFDDMALIVIGGGLSTRFGSDKLSAPLDGRPVAVHLLDAIATLTFSEKVLVARGQAWTMHYETAGFEILDNPRPEEGQSLSLRLALAHTRSSKLMVLLADMPFVSAEHLRALASAFQQVGGRSVVTKSADYQGPPVIFQRSAVDPAALVGDMGARKLLTNPLAVAAPASQLVDIDYPGQIPL